MNVQCSGVSRSFAKETRALKRGAWRPAIGSWQWPVEQVIKADPLTATGEVAPGTQCQPFYGHLAFGNKLERWKSTVSGCFMRPQQIKKVIIWLLLFCATTVNHSSVKLSCVMKSEIYVTTGDDQLSGWTENFQSTSQSQTGTEKVPWSLFGGLLLVWPTTAFWIPVKPLPLGRMLSKSVRCVINCNVCRSYCSTERNKFFSTTTPSCMSHSRCIKGWTNWVTKLCLIHHIHLKWHR